MRHKYLASKRRLAANGFTIVELITTISVMAVLASIIVIGYSSWRQTTIVNQLKSDLKGAVAALENGRNFSNGYPTSIPSTFVGSNDDVLSGGGSSDGKTFCVEVYNRQLSSVKYHVDSSNSVTAQSGACPTYTLTVLGSGAGGEASGGGTFMPGTVRNVTATPNPGYNFSGWSNCSTSTSASISVTMNSDLTCVASFSLIVLTTPVNPNVNMVFPITGSPTGAITMSWNWNTPACPGGSTRFWLSYWYRSLPSGSYVSLGGGGVTTANSVTHTFSAPTMPAPVEYFLGINAQCYNGASTSGNSPGVMSGYQF
jgi:prepilin-type N-terminal cleavage/methylation domain-containing protein